LTRISFLGAAGTITGSKYLVETETAKMLVDCGLFQGVKAVRERNWSPLAVVPAEGIAPGPNRGSFGVEQVCGQNRRKLKSIRSPERAHVTLSR